MVLSCESAVTSLGGIYISRGEDLKGLDWRKYPVVMTLAQRKTIPNFAGVLAVLEDTWKSPSDAARIPVDKITCPSIRKFDADYFEARKAYRERLTSATEADKKELRALPAIKIGCFEINCPTLVGVLEFLGVKYKESTIRALEHGQSRVTALLAISVLEEQRLTNLSKEIVRCVNNILSASPKPIVELHLGKYDVQQLHQLNQLKKIWHAVFLACTIVPEIQEVNNKLQELPQDVKKMLNDTEFD
jgi:hypothetical protein